MSWWVFALMLVAAQSSWSMVERGGEVGNGGDVLDCGFSTVSDLGGLYTLDYVVTRGMASGSIVVKDAKSTQDSLDSIAKALLKASPKLAADLRAFSASFKEPSSPVSDRVWIPAEFGLIPIWDENLTQYIPANCYSWNTGKISMIQTVVRKEKGAQTYYYYDKGIIADLEKFRPLQLSFLLMHEWLWGYIQDVEKLRIANFYLHTSWRDAASAEQLRTLLAL